MSRNKPPRKPSETSKPASSGIHPHWLWVALLVGLVFGGFSGYLVGRNVLADAGAQLDRYGRPPSHAHYNHNHP